MIWLLLEAVKSGNLSEVNRLLAIPEVLMVAAEWDNEALSFAASKPQFWISVAALYGKARPIKLRIGFRS